MACGGDQGVKFTPIFPKFSMGWMRNRRPLNQSSIEADLWKISTKSFLRGAGSRVSLSCDAAFGVFMVTYCPVRS
jgi:hypothetical protein